MMPKTLTFSGLIIASLLLAALTSLPGCVVSTGPRPAYYERRGYYYRDGVYYREGYYDREHSRYYHDHSWHECLEHDPYCR